MNVYVLKAIKQWYDDDCELLKAFTTKEEAESVLDVCRIKSIDYNKNFFFEDELYAHIEIVEVKLCK